MGSGSTYSPSSMAFSENGWSWFRGSPRGGDVSPGSVIEDKFGTWSTSNEAGDRAVMPSGSATTQMTTTGGGAVETTTSTEANDNTGMNIFSSSLPDLFRNKLGLLDVQPPASDPDEEAEANDIPLEELELHAIGNLLPDDDELLAETTTDMPGSCSTHDSEDFDFFSNGGGLELDGDGFGPEEQASRTIFVRNINSNVEDDELRSIFERFGDIRTVYTGCKHEGLVLISYYDIRSAKRAMRALQNSMLWGRKLDMHFFMPKDGPQFDVSQGIVAVFNVDPSVSNDDLREIFGVYGDIKEVHDTPMKHRHRFIEYYDARAAESALRVLNRQDVLARRTRLDPNTFPFGEEFDPEDPYLQSQQLLNTGYAGSLLERELQQAKLASYHPLNPLVGTLSPHAASIFAKAGATGDVPATYPYSELDSSLINQLRQSSALSALRSREGLEELSLHGRTAGYDQRGLGAGTLRPGLVASTGLPYLWGNPQQTSPLLWPSTAHLYGKVPACGLQNHLLNPVLTYPQLDRRRALLRQSAPPAYAALRLGARSHSDRKSDLSKGGLSSTGRFGSRHRSRRGESNAADKEQYHLDLERIVSGEDKRTTLMLKNIPNKYTSKMLLAVIDEANQGTYDFIYLPIDFKNKCNVGYAFVNMIEPSYIISFYKAFNGKKWEKFNSEKVASVAYARIQGKAALVAHFQNSSLMNECRPIVFGEEGNTPDDPGKEIGIVMGSDEATKL